MDRSRDRLQDILDLAGELADHLQGATQASFRRHRGLQRIAERILEICGEAANAVPDEVLATMEADWAGLRRMRILLAHAYHRVDPDQLWVAATKDLPAVAKAIRKALGS